MTVDRPAIARGAVYRLALNVTAREPAQRLACIPPGRAALRSAAQQWGITGSVLDDVHTITAELLTNAVQHAPPGTVHATLRLALAGDRIQIEVTDCGRRLPRQGASPGDRDAERGRGLLMVAALADRWGVHLTSGGKLVWAELTLPMPVDVPNLTRQAHRAAALADLIAASRLRAAAIS